jgi:transcriptional regulator with PAS, ATPase and Fis domain
MKRESNWMGFLEGERRMIKALVIVPYEGLYEIMKEVEHEAEDFQFHIELGNLHEGVAIAKEAENNGYHVIISRGGTASLIQKAVSIPVIDIPVTGYDVLRIITLVKGFSRKAAIVGFSNITQGAATVSKLLDLNMKTITITEETEVQGELLNLKNEGYEVVIGDVITVKAAKQLGLTGVLITSGKEAIIDALDEARRSYHIFSRLQENVSLFQSLLDSQEQAIAVFDIEEKFIYGNGHFHNEFQWVTIEKLDEIKGLLQEAGRTQEKQRKTVRVGHTLWKITASPKDGAIALFFEKNPAGETITGDSSAAIEVHTSASNIPFTGKSKSIQQVLAQIEQYGKREEPVWITGEKGSGKDLAARSLYIRRKTMNEPFIIVRCDLLKEEQQLNTDFFHQHSNGIVYFKHIDHLNIAKQTDLLKVKRSMKLNWFASSESNIEEKVNQGTFLRELYEKLEHNQLHMPPLRDRKDDIDDLVHVFISELHPKFGNSVVGIRQEALEELMSYDWPGNVGQLKQVIADVFTHTSSFYIEKEEVEKALKQADQPKEKKDAITAGIDISGTLEEIEKQVIEKVLEEEGFNQSKAAKRLGINRSTLWRKLK